MSTPKIINHNTSMSSLHRRLTAEENKIVYHWMRGMECDREDIQEELGSLAVEEKYSQGIVIKFKSRVFSLYSSYGIFRIGSGGALTEPTFVEEIIDEFIESLTDF